MQAGFFAGPGWAGFGFGIGRGRRFGGRRFKRGILKYVLLKLLAEEPRHGYDLIRAFRHKGWPGGAGSIYPILSSLEEQGFIAGHDEGDRRTYEVTEKGRKHLEEHAGHLEAFFDEEDEDGDEAQDARTELREAAGRLMQAVAQLGAGSAPETVQRVRDLLDRTRKEIYTLLSQE
ncbi:MAG TPA: PadR family transcriptional regulator [Candidatus Acidoferrales bacterium]|nr:PadR family transcriptional regulator [Candidatus Acidoferrales bacterium]